MLLRGRSSHLRQTGGAESPSLSSKAQAEAQALSASPVPPPLVPPPAAAERVQIVVPHTHHDQY